MSGPEGTPISKLSGGEKAMFLKFVEKNPGITEDDFIELRGLALSGRSSAVKNLLTVNGIVMEEKDLPSAEEVKDTYL